MHDYLTSLLINCIILLFHTIYCIVNYIVDVRSIVLRKLYANMMLHEQRIHGMKRGMKHDISKLVNMA